MDCDITYSYDKVNKHTHYSHGLAGPMGSPGPLVSIGGASPYPLPPSRKWRLVCWSIWSMAAPMASPLESIGELQQRPFKAPPELHQGSIRIHSELLQSSGWVPQGLRQSSTRTGPELAQRFLKTPSEPSYLSPPRLPPNSVTDPSELFRTFTRAPTKHPHN